MKLTTISMLIISVLLTSGAQVSLKWGMMGSRVQSALSSKVPLDIFVVVAMSPWIVGGLLLFAVSVVVWLAVLAAVPLSTAYPFVALGICITSLAGRLIFGEAISAVKMLGLLLIVVGISLVAAGFKQQ
jgi:multidrug transporter EmrE-like cation transporter